MAEKLRCAVQELPPVEGGMDQAASSLTLSLGGTSLGSQLVDAELLVSCADHALYQAKHKGRNQVQLWVGQHAPEPSDHLAPQAGAGAGRAAGGGR